MGPGIGVLLPKWPPPQIKQLKQFIATTYINFSSSPSRSGEEWRFQLGQEKDSQINIWLGPWRRDDNDLTAQLGWKPAAYVELYAFKSCEIAEAKKTLATLAHEIAERFGGVIAVGKKSELADGKFPGKLYAVPDVTERGVQYEYYADAECYDWIRNQPEYELL